MRRKRYTLFLMPEMMYVVDWRLRRVVHSSDPPPGCFWRPGSRLDYNGDEMTEREISEWLAEQLLDVR